MNIYLYTLLVTQLTILSVTLFLHRCQAHRSVNFHPVITHVMRFWLWLTTGMKTQQWVAVHRKHHRFSDQPGDPHSPHVFGLARVFTQGALLYHQASKDADMVAQYGAGTPDDWIERTVYSRYSRLGLTLMGVINLILWGPAGLVVLLVQIIWIPFWAAGVVNGIAHWWGYRNGETRDQSRNVIPWDFIVGGELLHNNHHLDPASARLSRKWWEFDLGWLVIRVLETVKLARVRR